MFKATAVTIALAVASSAAVVATRSDESERIQKSIEVIRDLTKGPDDGIPNGLIDRAEAIVVIPNLVKGGFVIGAKHGRGVVSLRDRATHDWSAPVFVKLTGGSIGWQIGVQSVDLVLLVMNKDGVDSLLQDKFTMGGSLSVSGGPVGRNADAATDAKVTSQILAYSRSKGLFAGATLEGAALRGDDDANEAFYGHEVSLKALTAAGPTGAKTAPEIDLWRSTLRNLTMVK